MTRHIMGNHPPSIKETAFDCPYCGAYTTQYWYDVYAQRIGDGKLPDIPTVQDTQEWLRQQGDDIPQVGRAALIDWARKIESGLVFFGGKDTRYQAPQLANVAISECYNCRKLAVWVHRTHVFPAHKAAQAPNVDLPEDIGKDYNEAREIVQASPRGAAALLRLCIQKLCTHLGESGRNIDDDIASLVRKGLDPLVQQSLDVVRVIGNEAVHPGVIDLNDEPETAFVLFDLVNAIVDQMISHPKKVQTMYGKLPEGKRLAIEERNKKAVAGKRDENA